MDKQKQVQNNISHINKYMQNNKQIKPELLYKANVWIQAEFACKVTQACKNKHECKVHSNKYINTVQQCKITSKTHYYSNARKQIKQQNTTANKTKRVK